MFFLSIYVYLSILSEKSTHNSHSTQIKKSFVKVAAKQQQLVVWFEKKVKNFFSGNITKLQDMSLPNLVE